MDKKIDSRLQVDLAWVHNEMDGEVRVKKYVSLARCQYYVTVRIYLDSVITAANFFLSYWNEGIIDVKILGTYRNEGINWDNFLDSK